MVCILTISLAEARDQRDIARKQLAGGIDPGVLKQTIKQAESKLLENSFEAVAREWFAKYSPSWVASSSRRVSRPSRKRCFSRGSVRSQLQK